MDGLNPAEDNSLSQRNERIRDLREIQQVDLNVGAQVNEVPNSQTSSASSTTYALQSARMNTQRSPLAPPNNTDDTNPEGDPVYELRQRMLEARQQQEQAAAASTPAEDAAAGAVSRYTDAAWLAWMWGSIPAILGDFGFNFMLATIASWVALIRTLKEPLLENLFGKARVALLPPAFSFIPGFAMPKNTSGLKGMLKITGGISSFGFFISAHLIWLLISVIIITAIIQVYLVAAPYVETASLVCRYFTIHPLCLIVPK